MEPIPSALNELNPQTLGRTNGSLPNSVNYFEAFVIIFGQFCKPISDYELTQLVVYALQ